MRNPLLSISSRVTAGCPRASIPASHVDGTALFRKGRSHGRPRGLCSALAPAGLVAVGLLVSVTGCASVTCDTGDSANPPIRYEDGIVVDGDYLSSSVHGGWLHFPGGRRYDLYHHLGYEPLPPTLYWAFNSNGPGTTSQDDHGTMTQAAGNAAEVQLINDTFIRVKNSSCSEFWLLVIARGKGSVRDTDAGVAGSDATEDHGSDETQWTLYK